MVRVTNDNSAQEIGHSVNKGVQLMSPAFISKTVTDDVHLLLVLLYLYLMRIEYIGFFKSDRLFLTRELSEQVIWQHTLLSPTRVFIFNALKIIVKRYTAFPDCIKDCIVCLFNFFKQSLLVFQSFTVNFIELLLCPQISLLICIVFLTFRMMAFYVVFP